MNMNLLALCVNILINCVNQFVHCVYQFIHCVNLLVIAPCLLVDSRLGVLAHTGQPDELLVDQVQFLLGAPQTVGVGAGVKVRQ